MKGKKVAKSPLVKTTNSLNRPAPPSASARPSRPTQPMRSPAPPNSGGAGAGTARSQPKINLTSIPKPGNKTVTKKFINIENLRNNMARHTNNMKETTPIAFRTKPYAAPKSSNILAQQLSRQQQGQGPGQDEKPKRVMMGKMKPLPGGVAPSSQKKRAAVVQSIKAEKTKEAEEVESILQEFGIESQNDPTTVRKKLTTKLSLGSSLDIFQNLKNSKRDIQAENIQTNSQSDSWYYQARTVMHEVDEAKVEKLLAEPIMDTDRLMYVPEVFKKVQTLASPEVQDALYNEYYLKEAKASGKNKEQMMKELEEQWLNGSAETKSRIDQEVSKILENVSEDEVLATKPDSGLTEDALPEHFKGLFGTKEEYQATPEYHWPVDLCEDSNYTGGPFEKIELTDMPKYVNDAKWRSRIQVGPVRDPADWRYALINYIKGQAKSDPTMTEELYEARLRRIDHIRPAYTARPSFTKKMESGQSELSLPQIDRYLDKVESLDGAKIPPKHNKMNISMDAKIERSLKRQEKNAQIVEKKKGMPIKEYYEIKNQKRDARRARFH